jgi:hypothetical protein
MNKFAIFSCIDLEETKGADYKGPAVVLANTSDSDNMLFFPITKEHARIIKKAMESDVDVDADMSILGIYKTMLDSWKAGDRYLSGISIETIIDNVSEDDDEDEDEDEDDEDNGGSEDGEGEKKNENEVPLIRLIISDSNGMIDSLVRVNFIHAILLAALLEIEIIISDRVLEQMMPNSDEPEDKAAKKHKKKEEFPEDKNIIHIARKIMQGKVKDINTDKDNKKK